MSKNKLQKQTSEQVAMKVSWVSIIFNVLLSTFKFIAGIIGKSYAMISDAIHSASDVFSTIVVMIGVKISAKDADSKHQYGHERYECVAAIVLAVILCATGVTIGYKGLIRIIDGEYGSLEIPGIIALIAAVISIVVKEAMYWYTWINAKKINSDALKADAWHHRSDALSSIGSFIGIFGAMLGYPILDSIACIVICIFIVKAALTIFTDAVKKMVDEACDDKTVNEFRKTILENENVIDIDSIQTRIFGTKIYIDIEICVDKNLSLKSAHEIATEVHDVIENKFELVKHCTVHVNPSHDEED